MILFSELIPNRTYTDFLNLKTAQDVASFLDISVDNLKHIAYVAKPTKLYTCFTIPKKSGGIRQIASPNTELDTLLRKFKPFFEEAYKPKACVHSFVSGRSIVSNANLHKKKKLILNIDLQNFYGSINYGRVRGMLMAAPFNLGKDASTIIAQLCVYDNSLPQGSCVSPILANLISINLDNRLIKLAKRYSCTYSRYADDITLSTNAKSFDKGIIAELGPPILIGDTLLSQIEQAGFKLNPKKTRLLGNFDRKEVTGLVINEFVNVPRVYIRNIRAMLHAWAKFGLTNAASTHLVKRNKKLLDMSPNNQCDYFKQVVYGKLAYVKMVRGEDVVYRNLCEKLIHLDQNSPKNIQDLINMEKEFDIFICHATEDKNEIAVPIYEACEKLKIRAFLDKYHIRWGDSLTARINYALSKSRFVVAIISESSAKKSWPLKEINTALNREIEGKQVLLPLLVGGDSSIMDNLPLLKEKLYIDWKSNPDDVANKIESLLKDH